MKVIRITEQTIELAGDAPEFANLARAIKKSKFNTQSLISLEGEAHQSIELICTATNTAISLTNGLKIEFTEATKNNLYSLISMPSDTPKGSVFTLSPCDHSELFSHDSIGIVLNVT